MVSVGQGGTPAEPLASCPRCGGPMFDIHNLAGGPHTSEVCEAALAELHRVQEADEVRRRERDEGGLWGVEW